MKRWLELEVLIWTYSFICISLSNMSQQLAYCTNKFCGSQETFTLQCFQMWPRGLWARNCLPQLRVTDTRECLSKLNQGHLQDRGSALSLIRRTWLLLWKQWLWSISSFFFWIYHCWWEKNFLFNCRWSDQKEPHNGEKCHSPTDPKLRTWWYNWMGLWEHLLQEKGW